MNSSLADVLDEDGSGEIDFKEFVEGITTLGVLGDREAKLKFWMFPNWTDSRSPEPSVSAPHNRPLQ